MTHSPYPLHWEDFVPLRCWYLDYCDFFWLTSKSIMSAGSIAKCVIEAEEIDLLGPNVVLDESLMAGKCAKHCYSV